MLRGYRQSKSRLAIYAATRILLTRKLQPQRSHDDSLNGVSRIKGNYLYLAWNCLALVSETCRAKQRFFGTDQVPTVRAKIEMERAQGLHAAQPCFGNTGVEVLTGMVPLYSSWTPNLSNSYADLRRQKARNASLWKRLPDSCHPVLLDNGRPTGFQIFNNHQPLRHSFQGSMPHFTRLVEDAQSVQQAFSGQILIRSYIRSMTTCSQCPSIVVVQLQHATVHASNPRSACFFFHLGTFACKTGRFSANHV